MSGQTLPGNCYLATLTLCTAMALGDFRARMGKENLFRSGEPGGLFYAYPEQLEAYRLLAPGERMAISLKMTAEQWPAMVSGMPEQIDRRFELLNRENDLRNQNVLKRLARSIQPRTEE